MQQEARAVVRKEGGRSWTIIHDPRLPFLEHVARERAHLYDEERNQAWFDTKADEAAIRELMDSLSAMPYIEIENAKYIADDLRKIPGVAVTKQPLNKKHVDQPNIVTAVAATDEAYAIATHVAERALRIGDAEATELLAAMDDGRVKRDDAYDVAGMRLGELRSAIENKTLTKPVAAELRDVYQPIKPYRLKKLVAYVLDGTLEVRNCALLDRANLAAPISSDEAEKVFAAMTEREARELQSYAGSLATPDMRTRIMSALSDDHQERGRISINESDLPTLERKDAIRILGSFAPRDHDNDDNDLSFDEKARMFDRQVRTRKPGDADFYMPVPKKNPEAARAALRYNANLYLRTSIDTDIARRTPAGADSPVNQVDMPQENLVVMDVLVATPYELAGYIDDARTQLVIADEGTFYYAKDTNYAMYSHDFAAVMTGRETGPLDGARLVLELGARRAEVDRFSQPAKPREQNTRRIGLKENQDDLDRAQKRDERVQLHEAAMQKTTLTRYAQVVDADGPLERQTMLLRATHDARNVAPNAPVTLASPYELQRGFEGKLLGRHDKSATLLVDRGQRGAAVIAIDRALLPQDARYLQNVIVTPSVPDSGIHRAPEAAAVRPRRAQTKSR